MIADQGNGQQDMTAQRHRAYRILDLGGGAGGAARGYQLAGFHVTGVDINHQPRYAGDEFIQADMLTFDLGGYDAIHLSAPCQRWAPATRGQRANGARYPDLITPMRPRLEATGVPWVMENVPQAPLRAGLLLCGCMFGLEIAGVGYLNRLRAFEFGGPGWPSGVQPVHQEHRGHAISICGHGTPAWQRRLTGHVPVAQWRQVMGISWMTREELTEAVPPAFTGYVGELLREVLDGC